MKGYLCCINCYDRRPLCHAECEKKAAVDAERNAIKKARAEEDPIKGYSREQKEKVERKRKQRKTMWDGKRRNNKNI